MRLTRWRRISPANSGPKRFHQSRTVSWHTSMPRSNSRSSTFRSDSGNRTYRSTTSRIKPGLAWAGEELRVEVTDASQLLLFTIVVHGTDAPAVNTTVWV